LTAIGALRLEVLGGLGNVQLAARLTSALSNPTLGDGAATAVRAEKATTAITVESLSETMLIVCKVSVKVRSTERVFSVQIKELE
jgi:hypothetical protein